jgi:hypothetical protein
MPVKTSARAISFPRADEEEDEDKSADDGGRDRDPIQQLHHRRSYP